MSGCIYLRKKRQCTFAILKYFSSILHFILTIGEPFYMYLHRHLPLKTHIGPALVENRSDWENVLVQIPMRWVISDFIIYQNSQWNVLNITDVCPAPGFTLSSSDTLERIHTCGESICDQLNQFTSSSQRLTAQTLNPAAFKGKSSSKEAKTQISLLKH